MANKRVLERLPGPCYHCPCLTALSPVDTDRPSPLARGVQADTPIPAVGEPSPNGGCWALGCALLGSLSRRGHKERGGGGCIKREETSEATPVALDRQLEEVAKAVGGSYCRLQMPLKLALGVRGAVAGCRLGALEGGTHPPFQCIAGGGAGGGGRGWPLNQEESPTNGSATFHSLSNLLRARAAAQHTRSPKRRHRKGMRPDPSPSVPSRRWPNSWQGHTCRASVCPSPLQTDLYVGSGLVPPVYPTRVDRTPGSAEKVTSGCQNQPKAKVARLLRAVDMTERLPKGMVSGRRALPCVAQTPKTTAEVVPGYRIEGVVAPRAHRVRTVTTSGQTLVHHPNVL